MNIKAINFIKNLSYSIIANVVALLSSFLIVLVVPKIIGVEEYGYWQLYLFYTMYVGFMHLGWNDGIYLRYGGRKYEDLDEKLFFSQFYSLLILQLFFSVVILGSANLLVEDNDKVFIISMTAIVMVIMNVKNMPLFIFQATNRIKEYAIITMSSKILSILFITILLVCGVRGFQLLIISDAIAKLISLFISLYLCKNIIINKISNFKIYVSEIFENIAVGSKLMFANIASLLIIGSVRFGIERSWNVETFGKVSLMLSLSNLLMVFINAVGIIIFPILKRTNERNLSSIYINIRGFLTVVLFSTLILYYPLKEVFRIWLPEYTDSLKYMALLFPIIIYEGKVALLINTYLKALREEKLMLRINILVLSITIPLTLFTTYWLKNLELAIASIICLLALRSIIAEFYLSKKLKISLIKKISIEVLITMIFVISAWFIDSWFSTLIYSITFFMYITLNKKDLYLVVKRLKSITEVR